MAAKPNDTCQERIRRVWRDSSKGRGSFPELGSVRLQNESIYCNSFRWKIDGSYIPEQDRSRRLSAFCADLVARASEPKGHFEHIDNKFSELISCNFQSEDSEETIISRACQILNRLPQTAPKVDFHNYVWTRSPSVMWPEEFFIVLSPGLVSPSRSTASTNSPWEQLQVVSYTNTTTLQLALQIAIVQPNKFNIGWTMQILVDLVSELLDLIDGFSTSGSDSNMYGKYTVLAYLWTTWQRSMMLLFYYALGGQLVYGYEERWSDKLALRGNAVLGHASVRATLQGWANKRSNYLCPWAFEMLKNNRSAIGLDFRTFHQRFNIAHHDRPSRCQSGSDEPCDGSHPLACGRFVDRSLVAEEQSMHDFTCSGRCKRLIWDESSYRSISGPRAVSLSPDPGRIKYCHASESTLSVSHVWSHGQGGRPESGINRCLHDRYLQIAKRKGCSSYWIDTICIPEAHELRKEAIRYINRIFADSKIVLICDKDLMSVDISNLEHDMKLLESILATFLVCDWNVRAWTLLEAVRGNHAIHLLCSANRTTSLREALIRVHREGSIDVAILFLAMRHLLPASTDGFRNSSSRKRLEEAGNLLSHRHATRDGDDIVIWSLLSDIRVYDTAEEMWKGKINRRINTGYLMTTTPRLHSVPGFSWAPSSPYVRRPAAVSGSSPKGHFFSFDGEGSESGTITALGLRAEWLVYNVDKDQARLYEDAPVTAEFLSSDGSHSAEILPGHRVLNPCWQTAALLLDSNRLVSLIQPQSSKNAGPYDATRNRGETHGPLIAICTSDDGERWQWKGVYEWSRSILLPEFVMEEILLV